MCACTLADGFTPIRIHNKRKTMSKSESKKLIPLYLLEYFFKNTDEEHYVRMPDILEYLETKGIYADRRTIYSAISMLNTFGFTIDGIQEKGNYKYHYPQRNFGKDELIMLIDAVSASKFLTEKKSKEIIEKIKSLGSKYDAASLNRHVVLSNRIKTMDDKVFQNLDIIYSAISNNKAISFKYVKWDKNKKYVYLRDGADYIVSPFAVTLSDDNYYLIAYDSGFSKGIRHYRIDKMVKTSITSLDRDGKDSFKSFNVIDYSKKAFNIGNCETRRARSQS
jgi:predicted DNA-binding transcriptional regulator YafY